MWFFRLFSSTCFFLSRLFDFLQTKSNKFLIQSIVLKRNSNNGFGISLHQKSLSDAIVVDLPDEGTGLEIGDQVLEINGKLTLGMQLTDIPKLLENFEEAKIVVLKHEKLTSEISDENVCHELEEIKRQKSTSSSASSSFSSASTTSSSSLYSTFQFLRFHKKEKSKKINVSASLCLFYY